MALKTIVFTDEFHFWFAAVEPGYNARRRARYALRQELVRRGLLETAGRARLQIESVTLGDLYRDYEIWSTTRAYPDPSRDGMVEK